jgi:hypothetical protein
MIYGPKTDRILAGVLTVASGGWIILILLGYLESQVWAQVPGLFVLFGIGVASKHRGARRRRRGLSGCARYLSRRLRTVARNAHHLAAGRASDRGQPPPARGIE